jgi:prolyl oligopeptidase
MFIVHKKSVLSSIDQAPEKPILTKLYAYGGYGVSITPSFAPSRLLFINNFNALYVVANIRGGGEYGEDWHKASVKEKKQNGFDDFIAAAEFLQEKRLTDSDHLVIEGGSNGGLLVSVVAN